MGSTPRRLVISRYGGPESLDVVPMERPTPGPDELLVRVRTAGVAFADIYARRGVYPGAPRPPFSPGFDAVGVVEAVGSRVDSSWLPGARVGCIVERGACSSYVVAKSSSAVLVPDGISDVDAVALLLNYVTVYQMLRHLVRVRKGDCIFGHALAGGVGTALLDLSGPLGLEVVGTASAGKHALVRALGGHPIDYRREDFVEAALRRRPEGYAGVLDGIGGAHLIRSSRLRSKKGRLVGFGFQSAASTRRGKLAVLPTLGAVAWAGLRSGGRAHFYAIMRFNRGRPERLRDDLGAIFRLYGAGQLRPRIAAVLPLSEAAEAHRRLEAGEARGKLVLRIDD